VGDIWQASLNVYFVLSPTGTPTAAAATPEPETVEVFVDGVPAATSMVYEPPTCHEGH